MLNSISKPDKHILLLGTKEPLLCMEFQFERGKSMRHILRQQLDNIIQNPQTYSTSGSSFIDDVVDDLLLPPLPSPLLSGKPALVFPIATMAATAAVALAHDPIDDDDLCDSEAGWYPCIVRDGADIAVEDKSCEADAAAAALLSLLELK